MRKRLPVLLAAVLVIGAGVYFVLRARATSLTLTGLVTTNDVIVSSQIGGQIGQLRVKEGDLVTKDQVLAVIVPDELRADSAYYAHGRGATSQVKENEARCARAAADREPDSPGRGVTRLGGSATASASADLRTRA
jgi:multidrug resistance efflux pump